jgi:hypothetical protein
VPLLIDDFKGEIGWSSTKGFVYGIHVLSFFRKTEVCNKGMPIFIEDNVLGLKITINDIVLMQSLKP